MQKQQNEQQNTNVTQQLSDVAKQLSDVAQQLTSVAQQQGATVDLSTSAQGTVNNAQKKKNLKPLWITLIIVATVIVIGVSTVLAISHIGKKAMHDYEDMTISTEAEAIEKVDTLEESGKKIQYNGATYVFNEDVTTVVLTGIDNIRANHIKQIPGGAGQADAVYIAVIDTKNSKVTILGVSRDAMVDVNVQNQSGEFVGTSPMQLCLAYAYGDGKHTSCDNTITSLERLFYGLEFDTYFSMNYPAFTTIIDDIDGVTLKSNEEFYSTYYGRTIHKGEKVTLYGDDALTYVRTRDLSKLDSNNDRMKNHKQFITAFAKKTFEEVKSDPSIIKDWYSEIKKNSTTNLNASKIVYLATTALGELDSYKDVEFVNIKGKVKKGECAEFYVNEDSLMETMIDLFYTKVE